MFCWIVLNFSLSFIILSRFVLPIIIQLTCRLLHTWGTPFLTVKATSHLMFIKFILFGWALIFEHQCSNSPGTDTYDMSSRYLWQCSKERMNIHVHLLYWYLCRCIILRIQQSMTCTGWSPSSRHFYNDLLYGNGGKIAITLCVFLIYLLLGHACN